MKTKFSGNYHFVAPTPEYPAHKFFIGERVIDLYSLKEGANKFDGVM